MVPNDVYERNWPCGEGATKTRFLLDKCRDSKVQKVYLRMYQWVYDDSLNNKAFNQTFLHACIFYYKDNGHKNKVNWGTAAAKVTEEHQTHVHNNPLKSDASQYSSILKSN